MWHFTNSFSEYCDYLGWEMDWREIDNYLRQDIKVDEGVVHVIPFAELVKPSRN